MTSTGDPGRRSITSTMEMLRKIRRVRTITRHRRTTTTLDRTSNRGAIMAGCSSRVIQPGITAITEAAGTMRTATGARFCRDTTRRIADTHPTGTITGMLIRAITTRRIMTTTPEEISITGGRIDTWRTEQPISVPNGGGTPDDTRLRGETGGARRTGVLTRGGIA